jgi:metallophosphoesterase superfamily enzyme
MGEMQTLRNSLLNFLLGQRVRVSVFLRQNIQNPDGTFIIPTSGPVALGNAINRSLKKCVINGFHKTVLYFSFRAV